MKSIHHFPSIILAASSLLSGSSVQANLIANGSFESPAGAPGLNSFRPAGWSGYGSFGNGLVNGPDVVQSSAFYYPDPFDGDQFVDIGTGEVVAQFTVTTPGDYVLKWHDNSLIKGWNGSYGVEIENSSLSTVVSAAYSYSYLTQSPPWRELSLDLSGLAADTYTLKFGPGSTYTFLDDVSVNLKAGVAAPDGGGTAPLLGTALLGMILLARRRRSSPAVSVG